MLDGNINQISTKELKHIIDNHHSNNFIVKNSALLTEMYSKLSNAINSTEMSVDDISKKFVEVLNKYSFIQKGSMKAWFSKNKAFYKAIPIVNFETGTFIDLAGAIGEAVEATENAKKAQEEADRNHQHFLNWCNFNSESLKKIDSLGFINYNQFIALVNEHYSKCNFVSTYLLTGIEGNKVDNDINALKKILLNNINTLKKTITDEQKNNVCTKVYTKYPKSSSLGSLIKVSLIE